MFALQEIQEEHIFPIPLKKSAYYFANCWSKLEHFLLLGIYMLTLDAL